MSSSRSWLRDPRTVPMWQWWALLAATLASYTFLFGWPAILSVITGWSIGVLMEVREQAQKRGEL